MTVENHYDDAQTVTTSSTSLQLAEDRTNLALVRTGFSTAAFGAGITHVIGRGVWPDSMVRALTIIFVLVGVMIVQAGLNRLQRRLKKPAGPHVSERLGNLLLITGVYLMQAALAAIILLTLLH